MSILKRMAREEKVGGKGLGLGGISYLLHGRPQAPKNRWSASGTVHHSSNSTENALDDE